MLYVSVSLSLCECVCVLGVFYLLQFVQLEIEILLRKAAAGRIF